jgi:hypothetical protein
MKLSRKLSKEQFLFYSYIAELTWGGIPVDIDWAIKTSIFQNKKEQLINEKILLETPM